MSIRSAFVLNLLPWMLVVFGVATYFTYTTASHLMEANYHGMVKNETTYLARHWADGREFPALGRVKQVLPLESANRLPLRDVGSLKLNMTEHHLLLGLKNCIVRTHSSNPDLVVALAPIISPANALNGIVVATYTTETLQMDRERVQMTLFLSMVLVSLLLIITLLIVARKMTRPLARVQASALAIAGGNYEQRVEVSGPEEIANLANTLNTMSECLEESQDRRKERLVMQEKRHGELQYAAHLQKELLKKSVGALEKWEVYPIVYPSENPMGLLIEESKKTLQVIQATAPGLSSILSLALGEGGSKKTASTLSVGQLQLFASESLIELFGGNEQFCTAANRILRHFSQDGLEATGQMLDKEISKRLSSRGDSQDLWLLVALKLHP